ncbi:interleukin-1 receptor type 1-like [Esox lucius]|uniref:Interleukin 1 receptor type 1 n=1 Tax=Esox lucius TaxID=8010 RepID=A0A3P8XZ19_ESOLU|nr:interleukin-1 receptor type 1-like [Esox lucius]
MDLSHMWFNFFSIFCLTGSSRAVGEFCKDYGEEFERVFSVPGESAMLNSTLRAPNVFNYTIVPHNISWYNSKTWRELTREKGKIVVRGTTLWIFNIEMEDAGYYVCIIRTPYGCFKQSNLLIVNQTIPDKCGRPYTTEQVLTNKANDKLSCPLTQHIRIVDNYTIQWYKECELITNAGNPLWGRFKTYNEKLLVDDVRPEDSGFYTCIMTFNLEGHRGRISDTIEGTVKMSFSLVPSVVEPLNNIIKADLGSPLRKRCRVFVPGVGKHRVSVFWAAEDKFISEKISEDNFQEPKSERKAENGVWLERVLNFPVVKEEHFYLNYTCQVSSDRAFVSAFFTLLPTDANHLLPLWILLTGLLMLTGSAFIYRPFKIDIVLMFRRMFPFLYTNTDSDGKVYDAYVTYPSLFGGEVSGEAEMFALHMLPQFLEGKCGYKLFILGRDSLPGQAIVDAVEESIQASRRLILVYSGTTFCSRGHSDKDSPVEAWQSFERQTAMHRTLLEGSLQVILVELEEITPTQLAFFPESVLHLRRRQGAICWWKSSRVRRNRGLKCGGCREMNEGEDRRGELASASVFSPSLSSSSRFWKELRYYMPVRGKRMSCPERTAC